MHTSYFLFVMVITMFCYAVIKGRPSKLRQSNPDFCPEKVSSGWGLAEILLEISADRKSPLSPRSIYCGWHLSTREISYCLFFFLCLFLFERETHTDCEQGRGRESGRHRI